MLINGPDGKRPSTSRARFTVDRPGFKSADVATVRGHCDARAVRTRAPRAGVLGASARRSGARTRWRRERDNGGYEYRPLTHARSPTDAEKCGSILADALAIGQHGCVARKDDVVPPEVIRRYLEAHDRRDADASLLAFARDAHVLDDGHDYYGLEAIRDWLARASTEFTYTRALLDASAEAPNRWLVRNRLEGDFPGGVVDLQYRFTLVDGLIADLAIVP
jgi:hypothetical protein